MQEQQRSKDRIHRRKTSKSPVYIRTKVKELEEKMHRNHKQQNRGAAVQNRVQHTHNNIRANNLTQTHRNHHMLHRHPDTKPLRVVTPQIRPVYWRHYNRVPDNSEQDLRELREQNLRFKQIYSKSLQKLQELEQRLQEMRSEHAQEKSTLQSTFRKLQHKLQNKKRNLAHIHTYEQDKHLLLNVQDKIITETEHQSSSCYQDQLKTIKISKSCSGLSINSK